MVSEPAETNVVVGAAVVVVAASDVVVDASVVVVDASSVADKGTDVDGMDELVEMEVDAGIVVTSADTEVSGSTSSLPAPMSDASEPHAAANTDSSVI